MDDRTPEEVWSVLREQAAEDAWLEQQLRDVAAMSDDALDAELRDAGYALADVQAQAASLGARGSAMSDRPRPPERAARSSTRRPTVLLVAAVAHRRDRGGTPLCSGGNRRSGGDSAAIGGGLLYAATHRTPPAPAPKPEPTPSIPAPVEPPVPDLVAAARLRDRASTAYREGHPQECLQLLDEARALDAAGDTTPEIADLRRRASRDKP